MAIIEQAMNKRMHDIASRHQKNCKKNILRKARERWELAPILLTKSPDPACLA